ncbi:hypothetical protein [Ureibacillus terrenus]|uniref:hypothetical protein n=1 Tax=Ureibacillus terrenus TaxID=118246 RepID=UPI002E24474F|nr:hypothetical protein [Ureibacillus terrenus]
MQTFFCIFNENLISSNHMRHYRQFRETKTGDRLPIFSGNKAVIFIAYDNCRYRVETTAGEVIYAGTGGIDEAVERTHYAQPDAGIEVVANGRKYTLDEYYRHIAPVVWLIAQFYDDESDRLGVAYERRKNGRLIGDGTAIFADDVEFADWLVAELESEERPPVVMFADWTPAIVRDKLALVDLNFDYEYEVNRGKWSALRKKAKKAKEVVN